MRAVLTTIVVLAALSCTAAFATKKIVVKPIDPMTTIETMSLGGSSAMGEPCQTGNMNTPSLVVSELVYATEEYRVVFDPKTGCDNCQIGFAVSAVRVIFKIDSPCSISLSVNLSVIDDSDPACIVPGATLCESSNFSTSLPMAGFWDIAVPISCTCVRIDRPYVLGIKITSSGCLPAPGLVIDTLPTTCTSWYNDGGGWTDLVATAGLPGNFMIYANANCCSSPVATESKSWGAIKDLYRDQ